MATLAGAFGPTLQSPRSTSRSARRHHPPHLRRAHLRQAVLPHLTLTVASSLRLRDRGDAVVHLLQSCIALRPCVVVVKLPRRCIPLHHQRTVVVDLLRIMAWRITTSATCASWQSEICYKVRAIAMLPRCNIDQRSVIGSALDVPLTTRWMCYLPYILMLAM
jgi:hypothetical protein